MVAAESVERSAGTRSVVDERAFYALPVREVARELGSDPEAGLSETEAAARLVRAGANALAQARGPAYGEIALRQIRDPLVALLLAAAVVSAAVGEALDSGVIAAIVLVNAALGFIEEMRAERAVLALRESVARRAEVVRAGIERAAPAADLVPGDLVVLREGDRVPADGRVASGDALAIDEAPLTGESVPVEKSTEPLALGTPLAERSAMVFAGTGVTRGRGRALVTATGSATEVGQIAQIAASAKPPPTPLQRRIAGLARVMALVGIVITVGLGVAMVVRGSPAHEAFLVGVSVAVAAVPEGLLATVTIALALGARAMAGRGAIVRRLAAVETLGSATVVASDKTGTLTENELRIAALEPLPSVAEDRLLRAGVLASTAAVVEDHAGPRVAGDPVDAAFLMCALARGIFDPRLAERGALRVIPFDAARRRMSLIYGEGPSARAFVKGAPEEVLTRSVLSDADRRPLERRAAQLARQGFRVLAVADRTLDAADVFGDEVETELEPLGLVALHDPPRKSVGPAIRAAHGAGLRVEMLTGDHPVTAEAIGRTLGLSPAAIHARVTPEEKLRLVERLQAEGEVVAVTGDGVNDSPALRQADVGVAMGRRGTEAAREAADLVLSNDDFATIVAAIREGRAITDNIHKFVAFLLSANLGEVFVFVIAILAGLGAPMTVVQILMVNVLTDGLPAVALARDPASAQTMARPPERSHHLFPSSDWAALAFVGALVGLTAFATFIVGPGGDAATTRAFATIALAELMLAFSLRSRLTPAWREPRNPYLIAGVAVSLLILGLALFLPWLREPLGTVRLSAGELALVAVLAFVPAAAVEALKWAARAGLVPKVDP